MENHESKTIGQNSSVSQCPSAETHRSKIDQTKTMPKSSIENIQLKCISEKYSVKIICPELSVRAHQWKPGNQKPLVQVHQSRTDSRKIKFQTISQKRSVQNQQSKTVSSKPSVQNHSSKKHEAKTISQKSSVQNHKSESSSPNPSVKKPPVKKPPVKNHKSLPIRGKQPV